MGIDTEVGGVFTRRGRRVVRHLQKHQGIDMEFHYLETQDGREFDVRDLPQEFIGAEREAVLAGQRESHRVVIRRAIDGGHSFGRQRG